MFLGCTSLKEVTLPVDLLKVGDVVFSECTSLERVILPESLEEIGNYAFQVCSSLTNIKLPKNLKEIGIGAFGGCTSLDAITSLANNPPICGERCFWDVPVTTTTLNVPMGSIELYKSTDPWSAFFKIIGLNDIDSVEEIESEKNDSYNVYNFNGLNFLNTVSKEDLDKLPAGLYIINGKKLMIKK